mmetsp:Transcript_16404/g.29642  ORF Transcript_16404/g.29642 Transcript_16404/m.29642 type:complete len:104 (-) Transcript_16404:93-404(-)
MICLCNYLLRQLPLRHRTSSTPNAIRDCKRFDVTLEKWQALEPLPQACYETSLIATEGSRSIYPIGGSDNCEYTDLIQRLSLDAERCDVLELKLPTKNTDSLL